MIACYGEALVDLFVSPYLPGSLRTDSRACLGGSVFNFCLAAQRQGMQAVYLNALSTDSFGRQFAHLLQIEGVLLDAKACSEPTSIAVIELDARGKAVYAFHRTGVADTSRSANDITAHWRSEIKALHTGCLMLTPQSWPQTQLLVAHAAAQGCMVSVDANLRLATVRDHEAYVACVKAACASAHLVKFSDDDLVALGALAASEVSDQSAAVRAARLFLHEAGQTQLVALTLGERGAWLLTRLESHYVEAARGVVVKDTVGAGDSFVAALLAHLQSQNALSVASLQGGLGAQALQWALAHAVSAATLCVQRLGCDPATWRETQETLLNR